MIVDEFGTAQLSTLTEAPIDLTLTDGLVWRLVEVTSGNVAIASSADGIAQQLPGDYFRNWIVPSGTGVYVPYWTVVSTSQDIPDWDGAVSAVAPPVVPVTSTDWKPTLDEVAAVVPTYTRGNYDSDFQEAAGAEQGTFTEDTDPSAREVQGLIDTAAEEIAGRVGVAIPERCFTLAKATTKWHVAMTIAAGKTPAGADDTAGTYRTLNSNFLASLSSLTELSRMPMPTRLA